MPTLRLGRVILEFVETLNLPITQHSPSGIYLDDKLFFANSSVFNLKTSELSESLDLPLPLPMFLEGKDTICSIVGFNTLAKYNVQNPSTVEKIELNDKNTFQPLELRTVEERVPYSQALVSNSKQILIANYEDLYVLRNNAWIPVLYGVINDVNAMAYRSLDNSIYVIDVCDYLLKKISVSTFEVETISSVPFLDSAVNCVYCEIINNKVLVAAMIFSQDYVGPCPKIAVYDFLTKQWYGGEENEGDTLGWPYRRIRILKDCNNEFKCALLFDQRNISRELENFVVKMNVKIEEPALFSKHHQINAYNNVTIHCHK